jgi:hypothetical protein
MFGEVVVDEGIPRFVNLLVSALGMLTAVWIVARWEPKG